MALKNIEGQRVPEVTFRTRTNGQWKDVKTSEVVAGKKVVVFALPGAFTPTCSSAHVPRYNELYREYFSAPFPARTTITNCLANLKYEIECIAVATS